MATSEAVLQVLSGLSPRFNGVSSVESAVKSIRQRSLVCHQGLNTWRIRKNGLRVFAVGGRDGVFRGKIGVNKFESTICECRRAKNTSGISAEEENRAWLKDEADRPTSVPINGIASSPGIDDKPLLKHEERGSESNGKLAAGGKVEEKLQSGRESPIEEEAWNLLRDSVVYYCNNPIGTIAANDPSSPSVLNYDQVFIRDFIPSAIAFLLKGEYDIVKNFILHTLQLQVTSLISCLSALITKGRNHFIQVYTCLSEEFTSTVL